MSSVTTESTSCKDLRASSSAGPSKASEEALLEEMLTIASQELTEGEEEGEGEGVGSGDEKEDEDIPTSESRERSPVAEADNRNKEGDEVVRKEPKHETKDWLQE